MGLAFDSRPLSLRPDQLVTLAFLRTHPAL